MQNKVQIRKKNAYSATNLLFGFVRKIIVGLSALRFTICFKMFACFMKVICSQNTRSRHGLGPHVASTKHHEAICIPSGVPMLWGRLGFKHDLKSLIWFFFFFLLIFSFKNWPKRGTIEMSARVPLSIHSVQFIHSFSSIHSFIYSFKGCTAALACVPRATAVWSRAWLVFLFVPHDDSCRARLSLKGCHGCHHPNVITQVSSPSPGHHHPGTMLKVMAPLWHHGTLAPRAPKKNLKKK